MPTISLETFRKRKAPTWPNPQDSVGKEFGKIPKANLSYWEATGPAQTAYQKLLPKVLSVLAEKQGPIPNSDFVWFSLYMVGLSPSTAAPLIMFASDKRSQRRKAMEYVKDSKILEEYPGMQVGEWVEAPHIGRQKQKGSSRELTYGELEIPQIIMVEYSTPIESRGFTVLSFHYPDRIAMTTSSIEVDIDTDNIRYYLVPSHVLLPPQPTGEAKTEAPDDSDNEGFDFGNLMGDDNPGEDDYLGEDDCPGEDGYPGGVHHPDEDGIFVMDDDRPFSSSPDSKEESIPTPHPSNQGDSEAYGYHAGANCPIVSIDLDYALCCVTGNDTHVPSIRLPSLPSIARSLAEPDENETQVSVLTMHGLLNGRLSRTRTHARLPNSSSYQEVYVVYFDSPVLAGDCGAMVYDASGRKIFGHIITGSANSTRKTAFVMPVKDVCEDIFRRLNMLYHTWTIRTADASHISLTGRDISSGSNTGLGPRSLPADDSSISTPSAGMVNAHHRSTSPTLGFSARSFAAPLRHHPVLDISDHISGLTNSDDLTPPLQAITTDGQLFYRNIDISESPIEIDIHGSIDAHLFQSSGEWTCYRQDSFNCACAFSLTPFYPIEMMHYVPNGSSIPYQILGFAMSISAVVSGSESMELVQHKPKTGEVFQKPELVKLSPRSSTQLPDSASIYQVSYPMEHTFERIQLKQASSNNVKNLPAWGYFYLIVELYADVGSQSPDQWVKIAQRKSVRIMLRGRSSGNYERRRNWSIAGDSGGSGGTRGIQDGKKC
ncbi:hypothetical protein F4804DRAFT_293249 [Jackrogersella minutella]|nr:hypothetical protein F4804DRAFT_293249 [Jackrogersella minutella]